MSNQSVISKGIDWVTVWLYIILVCIGILCIFSVEYHGNENIIQSITGLKKNYSRQILFLGISSVIAVIILLTDSKFFTATANLSYVLGLFLMIATFVVGKDINGSKSWIPLGFFNLQPVETCKIFTALALSKYLSRPETNFEKPRSQLIAAAIILTPAAFSILQNETGLALVYFSFLIPMYREGLPPVYLIIGFSFAILVVATILVEKNTLAIILTSIAGLTVYILRKSIKRDKSVLVVILGLWILCVSIQRFAVPYIFNHVLHPYQVERILNTFGVDYVPDAKADSRDPEQQKEIQKSKALKKAKENYNVKQSKIAIGSGGLFGKGFLKGTQTQGDFVPEQHTDFIFTSVGENFGFLGSSLIIILYLLFMLRIVFLAERQRSTFSRVYAYSVAAILFFHVTINICMTVGLAPVIGITLPLMSYGGSSLLTFTILIFILVRLDADRHMVLR
ncbi:rod shape-determining protein RodA [Ginsengibacter hankyongi]|uniref:Cell wall polymerase n=1 Tax=Ginsengibacter hankyongi TaxID=2607284 RepID=A0A5J5IQF4_9BACT|nr:rod shape-determining protein RodA [Ginsengibacter hankyongi]KAA9041812.1 rod shape-determining protein RodA [Ginsengibacter hankyongi]